MIVSVYLSFYVDCLECLQKHYRSQRRFQEFQRGLCERRKWKTNANVKRITVGA